MDTNQNAANNYQINTFVKGMNSDTSYDMIGADQYLFGLNIRITSNTLIFGDQHLNFTEGIVTPVYVGNDQGGQLIDGNRILYASSIDNIGAIITSYDTLSPEHHYICIYLAKLVSDNITLKKWYEYETNSLTTSISAILHKETEGVLSLYIADGEHPVIQIDLLTTKTVTIDLLPTIVPYVYGVDVDYLISGRLLPTNRFVLEKVGGRLKTQQILYTYRFYKKHGTSTKLAPLTNKFNVIDANRNKEQGNAEDTRTSIGFKLTLNLSESSGLWDYYDHIQVYRISYIKQHEQPHIYLIHDDVYTKQGITEIIDKGEEELQELSLDEYYALNSQIIIPKSIESNQGYLFAGNIQDDTVFYIDENLENSFEYVKSLVPIDSNIFPLLSDPVVGSDSGKTYENYFRDCGIVLSDDAVDEISYNSIVGSSLLRSLRRDECYRYGVVYYDKTGARSNVIKIDPPTDTIDNDEVEKTTGTSNITQYSVDGQTLERNLFARPIGIKCTIEIPTGRDIVGYQIVRCEKTDSYTKNILQVALSRPSRQSKWEKDLNGEQREVPEYRTPYYPNVYLSTLFLYITYLTKDQINNSDIPDIWRSYFDYAGTNVENVSLYQAFSPEINILRKDTVSLLSLDTIYLTPIKFAYYNDSLDNIAALFETAEYSLDVSTTVYVYFQSNRENENYKTIQYASDFTIDQVTNQITITRPQETNYRIQVFVPSGYEILDAYYSSDGGVSIINHTTWEDITTFVFNFGTTPDNLHYHYYRIDGKIDTGEVLIIKFKERSQATGSHIVNINPSSVGNLYSSLDTNNKSEHILNGSNGSTLLSVRSRQQQLKEEKSGHNVLLKLYSTDNDDFDVEDKTVIENIADVKNPDWSLGFSSIQLGGDDVRVVSAIKQYKSFTTNVGGKQFVNWVANGMYDLAATQRESSTQLGNTGEAFVFHIDSEDWDDVEKGWIGPGPVSLLFNTKAPANNSKLRKQIEDSSGDSRFGTIIANVSHTPVDYSEKYSLYYGFGNFRPATETNPIVFDGDIYITPAEFTNMFKTYDFNDQKATLMSGQDVYYIPMESRINTFFDYGMNYRNTSSSNLMLEPGEITGILSLARPLHQYNMIYSDNNTSIDVFSPQVPEDLDSLNHIPHRICYSQLKTDGENIDSWQIFKPIDFIDVDSKYGEITHLLTSDNTLYYWQNDAFGKLSVNERSLVKDENSNSIQLGTGGVLNRYDYLSTRYGMRAEDRAAVAAERGIYWIDVKNKAVPAFTGNGVVNYSEICNVQNLINQKISEDIPTVYYDLQNYELLCGIRNSLQCVFNLKLNCATSTYTRSYEKCIDFGNLLFGLNIYDNNGTNILKYNRINYITSASRGRHLLDPVKIKFSINPQASLTKVYDNQKIVLMDNVTETGRNRFPRYVDYKRIDYPFLSNKTWEFKTDYQGSSRKPEAYRDTENNIWYAITRNGETDLSNGAKQYGDRLKGKWMTTLITITNPEQFAISHIITKFRQSYS